MGVDVGLNRLAMRSRPDGSAVMEQRWEKILFLHWPVPEVVIRSLVPAPLEIDTFDHSGWMGITPFRLTRLRIPPMPVIPGFDAFNELNVRTYVHYQGMPGIYFLSLDASKLIPAVAARIFYQLPYFSAEIDYSDLEGAYTFRMKRDLDPDAGFRANWRRGVRLRAPDTESLAFFLIERYGFFAVTGNTVSLTRAYHSPWILEEAMVENCESTLHKGLGMPELTTTPLTHFSDGVDVQLWPPTLV
jgi:uncharacterized protein